MRLDNENFENMRCDNVLGNAIHDNSLGRYVRALGVYAQAQRERMTPLILRRTAFSRNMLSKIIEPEKPDFI